MILQERFILTECKSRLRGLSAVTRVTIRPVRQRVKGELLTAQVTLETKAGPLHYTGAITRWVTRATVEWLRDRQLDITHRRWLLLTEQVSGSMAIDLVNAEIDFVDAAGNVFLHKPGKIWIQQPGIRPHRLPERQAGRLSKPSGLQVLFFLLSEPTAMGASFRDIARQSGVALGSVAFILRDLKEKGYLEQQGRREWRLVRRRELLDLWLVGYRERLRPKLVLGRFQPSERDLELSMRRLEEFASEQHLDWAVTGGWAADILIRHFRGDSLSFFTKEWSPLLIQKLRWLPSPNGPIFVLRRFGPSVTAQMKTGGPPVAHPLLIYAELLHHGGERERETARRVCDRYIAKLLEGKVNAS